MARRRGQLPCHGGKADQLQAQQPLRGKRVLQWKLGVAQQRDTQIRLQATVIGGAGRHARAGAEQQVRRADKAHRGLYVGPRAGCHCREQHQESDKPERFKLARSRPLARARMQPEPSDVARQQQAGDCDAGQVRRAWPQQAARAIADVVGDAGDELRAFLEVVVVVEIDHAVQAEHMQVRTRDEVTACVQQRGNAGQRAADPDQEALDAIGDVRKPGHASWPGVDLPRPSCCDALPCRADLRCCKPSGGVPVSGAAMHRLRSLASVGLNAGGPAHRTANPRRLSQLRASKRLRLRGRVRPSNESP